MMVLASCAAPTSVGRKTALSEAPRAQLISPVEEACRQYFRLRDQEAGSTLPAREGGSTLTDPGALRIDAAQEHFRRAAQFGFSGGMRLLEEGTVRLSTSSGFADHSRRIPMRDDTVFDTGSVSKQFTAAAILRLEELGQLQTSDTIAKFFPDAPPDKRAITIHQLLSHQAGFIHSIPKMNRRLPRDLAAKEILDTALIHPIGSKMSYSNAGYALLAIIVDKASNSGYEKFLRDELWLPLGMTKTGMVLPDWSRAQVADGLDFTGSIPVHVEDEWTETGDNWLSRGAAGVSSTLPDLTRWAEALRTGAVLSHTSRRKLFWPHARESTKRALYYAYGWGIGAAQDGSCLISHNGGAGIHYDVLSIFPSQATVVATFNTQQRTPWSANDNFVERLNPVLTGTGLLLPETRRGPADARHAGIYELPSGERLRVVAEGGHLIVPSDNVAALRLFAPWRTVPNAADPPVSRAVADQIVEGIDRGDFRLLIERLPSDIKPPAEVDFWTEYWPRWIRRWGAYRGTDVIGSFTREDKLHSLVRLRFERSAIMAAFVHSPGGKMFLDIQARSFYPEVYLAPAANDEYLAFYPTTRRTISVRFDSNSMIVSSDGESTVARRVGS
jgi:CubicO group peptidase (beta-lactamase class C family)